MWTPVNCCLVWHRKTDVESWHGQVFLNINLSYLRFCFQSADVSSVTSVSPLSLSNSPRPPRGLISLNLAVFTVTSILMTRLYSECQADTPACSSHSQRHSMRNIRAAYISICLSLREKNKVPNPWKNPPLFPFLKVWSELIYESHFHYFALEWFYFTVVHTCSVLLCFTLIHFFSFGSIGALHEYNWNYKSNKPSVRKTTTLSSLFPWLHLLKDGGSGRQESYSLKFSLISKKYYKLNLSQLWCSSKIY